MGCGPSTIGCLPPTNAAPSPLPQHFGLLLEQLHDIYLTNTRESILKTCAKTYKAMLSQEHAMRKEAEVAFGRLTDELADRLLQALPTLDPAVRPWT